MDYLLRIWSVQRPEDGFAMPKISDHDFVCDGISAVTPEDIEPTVRLSCPGIGWLTLLRLAPAPTDYARKYAMKFARKLAAELNGTVEDAQPPIGGEKFYFEGDRFAFPPVNEYTKYLSLCVWSEPVRGFDADAAKIVDAFEKYLPFALGSYGSLAGNADGISSSDGGREGFAAAIGKYPGAFFHGTLPGLRVYFADASRQAAEGDRRVNFITVALPDKYYDEEQWKFSLNSLMCELARITGAFFAQIVRGETQVSSWWWRGIPVELGSACVIGEPYYSLIPDCAAKGIGIADHTAYFVEPDGPYIDAEYLSCRKKRLFGKRENPRAADFTAAKTIPVRGTADIKQ